MARMLSLPENAGQAAAKCALWMKLVSLSGIAILLLFGPQMGDIFSTVTNRVSV